MEIWKTKTSSIETIKELAHTGALIDLKLSFSFRYWTWIYVATFNPY